jgi:hypothetical protein
MYKAHDLNPYGYLMCIERIEVSVGALVVFAAGFTIGNEVEVV